MSVGRNTASMLAANDFLLPLLALFGVAGSAIISSGSNLPIANKICALNWKKTNQNEY